MTSGLSPDYAQHTGTIPSRNDVGRGRGVEDREDGLIEAADQADVPDRQVRHGLALEGLDLGEGDRVGGHADLPGAGEVDEGLPDRREGFGEVREGAAVGVNGLGEGDQAVGEAFMKFARSSMKARAWAVIQGNRV